MTGRAVSVLLATLCGAGPPAAAQDSLAQAAERVRQAWLGHDAQAIVGQGAKVVLRIPGAAPSTPLEPAQAIELVRRHLQGSVERAVSLVVVREVGRGQGYVELDRCYVVSGTSDERHETIVVRFHKPAGEWLVSELRSGR